MEVEHCFALDSLDTFVTSNYGGTQTHPRMEWEFVVCPVAGKAYPGIIRQPDPLENFLYHPTATEAALTREEVRAGRRGIEGFWEGGDGDVRTAGERLGVVRVAVVMVSAQERRLLREKNALKRSSWGIVDGR